MEFSAQAPNGLRYPRVGGTRERCFDGTNSKPQKLPENAQTPTRRVHAVLGCVFKESEFLDVHFLRLFCTSHLHLQHPFLRLVPKKE